MLVARADPLDQYLMRHPEFFFGRAHEEARISPENRYILAPHLLCAAYESPLTPGDEAVFGPTYRQQAEELVKLGHLREGQGRWFLDPSVSYPAQEVGLRAAWGRSYTLVEGTTGRVLEEGVEETAALAQLHPGAVYLHQGEAYLVNELDRSVRTAVAVRTEAPYYTQAQELTDTRILQVYQEKLAHFTDQNLGEALVDLPPHRFRTTALWFEPPAEALKSITASRGDLAGGLHAAIGILPLFALCDRNDIGGVSTPLHPDTGRAEVFIHDGYPGGVGIAERGFAVIEELWKATLRTVAECPCRGGCPGCIQSPKCGNNNQPLDKAVAVFLLRSLLGLAT